LRFSDCERNAVISIFIKKNSLPYIFSVFFGKLFRNFFISLYILMATNEKVPPKFSCEVCYYNTSRLSQYERHILTPKHKKLTTTNRKVPPVEYACKCGKIYKHSSSLCKHRTNCHFIEHINNEDISKNEIIKQLLMQNQQLIFDNQEFKNMILEIVSKPTTSTINNTNCNNKQQFNLQVFLNEKCKDAMNMSDFISSLKILDEDFENIGKLGYVQGISNIFIKGLKDLDETMRPIHCNDIKRETLYIKDNDVWGKDDNKHQIRHAIALIAHKNFKYIPIWIEANPQALDGTTNKNDQYMRIANQVTTAITPDDDSGINKIIRNVANKVIIDKENYNA